MKEKKKKQQKQIKYGLAHYLNQNKRFLFPYILFVGLMAASEIISILYFANFLAEIGKEGFTFGSFSNVHVYLIVGTVGLICVESFNALSTVFFEKAALRMQQEIKTDLASQIFYISSKTFTSNSAGVFLERINKDPFQVVSNVSIIIDRIQRLIKTFSVLLIIFLGNVYMGLMLAFSLIVLITIEVIRQKIYKKNNEKEMLENENSAALVGELVRSEKDIKTLSLEDELFKISRKRFTLLSKSHYKTQMNQIIFWWPRRALAHIFIFGMLLAGLFLFQGGALAIAALIFFFTNKDVIVTNVWYIGDIMTSWTLLNVAQKRMFELFNKKKFPVEKFGHKEAQISGTIEFKNVWFSYEEEIGVDEKEIMNQKKKRKKNQKIENKIVKVPVLKGINFKLEANKTYAFVGKTGSGKSTILSLISKLNDADEGEILFDENEITKLSKKSLRGSIALVNQFPYLFNATIKENLRMVNKDATDEEIYEVCKQASLHDLILKLPYGYDTTVGEGGLKLSGGQRQRLAIARALLKRSRIILFDEATSALDNETQEEIKQSINNLGGNYTIIIVAHRLSTIRDADKIFYLENGVVKNAGSFKQLLKWNEDFNKAFMMENQQLEDELEEKEEEEKRRLKEEREKEKQRKIQEKLEKELTAKLLEGLEENLPVDGQIGIDDLFENHTEKTENETPKETGEAKEVEKVK